MNDMKPFDLMVQAFSEVAEEERAQSLQSPPVSDLPSLASAIANASPLPEEALFLGLADDELPVLLNLYDPIPGPLLIIGDPAIGKTAYLKMIARSVEIIHSAASVQYCVITRQPAEWKEFHNHRSNAGIHSATAKSAEELLQALAEWAHNNKGVEQSILLLIDDLEPLIQSNPCADQNLRWLLLRGPSRRVWPIVTMNSKRAQEFASWLGFFHTRLFGYIQDAALAQFVTSAPNPMLDKLIPHAQFSMREGKRWLRFWIPTID